MLEYYVKKRNFKQIGDEGKQTKYFARLDEKTMLDTDELCRRVADRSTLAKGEMRLAVDMLCEMVFDALKSGRSVRLGEIGVLHPTMKTKVCQTKEEVTIETIKDVTCTLRVSERLKKALKYEPKRKIVLPQTEFLNSGSSD